MISKGLYETSKKKSYDCVDTDHQILIDQVIQEKSPEMDSFWKDVTKSGE